MWKLHFVFLRLSLSFSRKGPCIIIIKSCLKVISRPSMCQICLIIPSWFRLNLFHFRYSKSPKNMLKQKASVQKNMYKYSKSTAYYNIQKTEFNCELQKHKAIANSKDPNTRRFMFNEIHNCLFVGHIVPLWAFPIGPGPVSEIVSWF